MKDSDDLLAASFFRNKRFAEWFVATLVLAAEAEPELVRNALAKVFGLKETLAQHEEVARRAAMLRQEVDALGQEIADLRATVKKANEYLVQRNGR